jgi:hypothetical protein
MSIGPHDKAFLKLIKPIQDKLNAEEDQNKLLNEQLEAINESLDSMTNELNNRSKLTYEMYEKLWDLEESAQNTHYIINDDADNNKMKRISNVRALKDDRPSIEQYNDLVNAIETVLSEVSHQLKESAPSSLLQDIESTSKNGAMEGKGTSSSSSSSLSLSSSTTSMAPPSSSDGTVLKVVYTSDLMCKFKITTTTTFGDLSIDVRKYFSIPHDLRFVLVDNLGVLSTPKSLVYKNKSNNNNSDETYFVKISQDSDERFNTLRRYRPEIYHVDGGRNGEIGVSLFLLLYLLSCVRRISKLI